MANGVRLHVREDGDPGGATVVFANSLGTDLRLWDALLPLLPKGLRLIRYDMRGHGLSDCPPGPYAMADLAADAEALIEEMCSGPVIFVGLSIGGMVGLCLAARRPDLVRGLVLSNTAARMGDPDGWRDRMTEIEVGGLASLEDAILDRWFGARLRVAPEVALWGAMLSRTPQQGYLACCAAIAGADLTEEAKALRVPVLAVAGAQDCASPPDLVAATAALIPGAACHVIDGAGHLPCVEDPAAYAAILAPFLEEHAHDRTP